MDTAYSNDDMHKELTIAIVKCDLSRVKELLEAVCDPNYETLEDDVESTFLNVATNVKITRELLRHGANIYLTDSFRRSPLHSAVIKRKGKEIIRKLISCSVERNSMDYWFDTPLTIAIQTEQNDIIVELIEQNCDFIYTGNIIYYDYLPSYSMAYDLYVNKSKLTIKDNLMQTLFNDEEEMDLTSYNAIWQLEMYMEDCHQEISELKYVMIGQVPLPLFLKRCKYRRIRIKFFPENFKSDMERYPIYGDSICHIVEASAERYSLYRQIDGLSLSSKKTLVKLSYDCLVEIAEYLNNIDMKNLITAIEEC